VWSKSFHHPALKAALDAEVPRARYKSGYKAGRFNIRAIRMALRRLDGLKVSHHINSNYWVFRVRLCACHRDGAVSVAAHFLASGFFGLSGDSVRFKI